MRSLYGEPECMFWALRMIPAAIPASGNIRCIHTHIYSHTLASLASPIAPHQGLGRYRYREAQNTVELYRKTMKGHSIDSKWRSRSSRPLDGPDVMPLNCEDYPTPATPDLLRLPGELA